MFDRITRWLHDAPITDEVDRRNAPVMQLLLLFYGFLLPANWAWRIASGESMAGANTIICATDMLIAALALVSIALIRHGRFRPAVMLFLAPQLISLEITFSMVGVMPQLVDPAPTMLCLAISGLVLGRRALWVVWGLLMAAFATGFATNLRLATESGTPIGPGGAQRAGGADQLHARHHHPRPLDQCAARKPGGIRRRAAASCSARWPNASARRRN